MFPLSLENEEIFFIFSALSILYTRLLSFSLSKMSSNPTESSEA
jgi:hypothetical protein